VTYQFLHDLSGVMHVLMNMLFLWVFGGAVESRFGRWQFLLFYLGAGTIAGAAHMAMSAAPVIGASGAVAGVGGSFAALFPRSRVRVLCMFPMVGVWGIPALWFIGFYFALDLLMQTSSLLDGGGERVAYAAHLAGYLYGFGLSVILLATKRLTSDDFDCFHLFRQSRRRAAMRAAAKSGAVWRSTPVKDATPPPAPPHTPGMGESPQAAVTAAMRTRIETLASQRNLPAAAAAYGETLKADPATAPTFTPARQLELAGQLMRDGQSPEAALAFERYLQIDRDGPQADEVRLMLAVIYARHLASPDRARPHLAAAGPRLRDASQQRLAAQLVEETS
jgi:hypothetical protein